MKDWCLRSVIAVGIVFCPVLFSSTVQGQSVVEGAFVGNIFAGTVVGGTLEAGDPTLVDGTFFETWAYTLAVPGFITIDLHSANFDTYLFLTLADDTILGENVTIQVPGASKFIEIRLVL